MDLCFGKRIISSMRQSNGTRPTFIIVLHEQANIIWLVATLGNFVVVIILEPIFYTSTNVLWASKAKEIIIIIFLINFSGTGITQN
jgi:hypothetical protein